MMAGKEVTVEYAYGRKRPADRAVKTELRRMFFTAAAHFDGVSISDNDERCSFTTSHEIFQRIVDAQLLTPPIVEAFQKADKITTEIDEDRSGFWARLCDSFLYHSAMTRGSPLSQCPQTVKDMDGVKVTIKRYGLAQKPSV